MTRSKSKVTRDSNSWDSLHTLLGHILAFRVFCAKITMNICVLGWNQPIALGGGRGFKRANCYLPLVQNSHDTDIPSSSDVLMFLPEKTWVYPPEMSYICTCLYPSHTLLLFKHKWESTVHSAISSWFSFSIKQVLSAGKVLIHQESLYTPKAGMCSVTGRPTWGRGWGFPSDVLMPLLSFGGVFCWWTSGL